MPTPTTKKHDLTADARAAIDAFNAMPMTSEEATEAWHRKQMEDRDEEWARMGVHMGSNKYWGASK